MNTAIFAFVGTTQLLVVLVIVVLLFGVGKLSEVGKQLGAGIRNFKTELGGNEPPQATLPVDSSVASNAPRDVTDEVPRT